MTPSFPFRSGLAAVMLAAIATASPANARDFFSSFFGGFNSQSATPSPTERIDAMPFASEGDFGMMQRQRPPRPIYLGEGGGGAAYCVRTCDGRYFPIMGSDNQSKAATCNSFCPASETKVVYGSNIDNAATDGGKPYSAMPNAFKYRTEIVANCTCNGKDHFGLAKFDLEKDLTVRKGDIVSSVDGLLVAGRSADTRHGATNFSPAAQSVRARYERLPVVASE